MPRRLTRRKRMLNPQPLTFSPFARSVAQIASIHRDKRQTYKSKDQKGSPLSSKDKGIPKHTQEGKSDLSRSSEEEGSEGVVQADFVFFDPKPDDFHGVKILLQTYLDDTQWDLSGFVDLILAQTTVGTVVKIEGDDDDTPFSIVTALNLGRYKADFVFFDPKPDDFHGVKILLQTYLDDTQWDLSGFVDLILAQTTVGTVVKIEGDDDDTPFSIVTALNLGRYKDHKCIKELKEFLLKVCQEKDVIKDLRLLMGEQAHDVGLLVSQRVVNLPPQLLPPLHDALFDEVSWATEDEPTAELRNSFRFKCYLLVSKIYKHKNANQKNNRTLIRRSGSDSGDGIVYIKPEDEIFHKLSLWSFSFPMHTQQVETQELKNYRLMGLVMAVEAAKISTFRLQLRSLVVES